MSASWASATGQSVIHRSQVPDSCLPTNKPATQAQDDNGDECRTGFDIRRRSCRSRRRGPPGDGILDAAAETSDPDIKRALIALCRREHRYGMELARRADATARRGQLPGFLAVTFVLILAGYVAALGEAEWAAAIAGIDVVGLAGVFVTGRWLAYRRQA
jgi:hypothetical protein